jgi:XTP/dITP diphosphohydrolase
VRGEILRKILIATSNSGKLRDFAGAAVRHGVEIAGIPGFSSLPAVVEDGLTFEANARKKAEEYSRYVPGGMVVADDSGLEIDALNGAPGVHSARYAAPDLQNKEPHQADANTDDNANNARVLRELQGVPPDQRTARFVCVLAAARLWPHFGARPKESSSTLRGAPMASATIRCSTFLRSRKHLPS